MADLDLTVYVGKRPAPLTMWAVVIIQKRSTWIHPGTINRTRKGAVDEWLADWRPEYQEEQRRQRNKTWRVERVTVSAVHHSGRD